MMIMMKKIVFFTLLISLPGLFSAQANQSQQQSQGQFQSHIQFRPGSGFSPDTGDAEFDRFLLRLNNTAGSRQDSYIADLSSAFHIPPRKIKQLFQEYRMAPVDVLLVLQLEKTGGYPRQKIIRRYRRLRPQGWRAIFVSFNIQPGSRTFLLLRSELPRLIVHYLEQAAHKGSGKKKGSKKRGSKKKKGSGKKGSKRR